MEISQETLDECIKVLKETEEKCDKLWNILNKTKEPRYVGAVRNCLLFLLGELKIIKMIAEKDNESWKEECEKAWSYYTITINLLISYIEEQKK